MLILTTAIGYSKGELSIFYDSLVGTGFDGDLVVVGDAPCLKDRGAIMIKDHDSRHTVNFRRWKAYSEFLKGVKEPVVLTDVRDVVFQKNPAEYMPKEGVNVFEEVEYKTIGNCIFNHQWMSDLGITKWDDKTILCSGVSSGVLDEYSLAMWKSIEFLRPVDNKPKHQGGDQAIHNNLIYSGFPAIIHKNEDAEVYTVGHLPLESVKVEDDFIVNKKGERPCMVHMYDRHVNLTASVMYRLGLDMKIFKSTLKGAMV